MLKVIKVIKYEIILWIMFFIKLFPGKFGVVVRRVLLPSKIGEGSSIWDGVQIDYPSNLIVGRFTSINRGCVVNCGGEVIIGNNVLIGPNVTIYSQNHCYKDKATLISRQGYEKARVLIEDDVWIASNVTVLPGVKIAKGCVIAAGAIVTKDTQEFCVYAGAPAKRIDSRK